MLNQLVPECLTIKIKVMKTIYNTQNSISKLMIICFVLLTNISFAQKPKPNCIVSPISGPTIIEGQGDVTLQYSVTSNGGHVWVLPEGCTQDVNGINDSRNIAIKFDASFSSGTIAVYRHMGVQLIARVISHT